MGATQGGVQDMQLARELIASGMVPPPEAFTVEGMFSEHVLPLAGGELEQETDAVRVFLFTDIQPDVGATDPGSFREVTADAAIVYGEDQEAAVARMTTVAARIAADTEQLADPGLAVERDLAEALLALMVEGAERGDLYPGR